MDDRWSPHNLHRQSLELFRQHDPTLRALGRQPIRHQPGLIDRLPLDLPGIYTLGGGRQVGKTTLVKQVMVHLLEECAVHPEQVAYVTGELFQDQEDFRRVISELASAAGELCYVFVDEVTYVSGWDKVVKFIADVGILERTFLLLTGSDLVLIQDALRRLPGRRGAAVQVDFHLRPLSFLEFCLVRGRVHGGGVAELAEGFPEDEMPGVEARHLVDLERELVAYHRCGGYLTAINDLERDGTVAPATLRIYSDWIRGDVLRRGRSEGYLREVLAAISTRYGSQVTWNALSRDLSINHPKTIADYCTLLERMDAACILPALSEHSMSAAPKKARKLYFTDPFIHRAVDAFLHGSPEDPEDDELLATEVEATVVNHLRRAFPTFYIKAEGEVDAAYLRDGRMWPIEVKWSRQLRPKDFKQLRKYPGALLAGRGREAHEHEGVRIIPAPVVLLRISRLVAREPAR